MTRLDLARFLAITAIAALLSCPAIEARAGQWRVFIQAQDRQLRSLVLEASGVSTLPEEASEAAHHASALADARANALETARLTLESEVAARNPAVRIEFPTLEGAAEDAVFVHQVDVMAPSQGRPYQVAILAEVVYVVVLPAQDAETLTDGQTAGTDTGGADQLQLEPPDSGQAARGGVDQDSQGVVDQDAMQQGYETLTRALQERLRQLLEE